MIEKKNVPFIMENGMDMLLDVLIVGFIFSLKG